MYMRLVCRFIYLFVKNARTQEALQGFFYFFANIIRKLTKPYLENSCFLKEGKLKYWGDNSVLPFLKKGSKFILNFVFKHCIFISRLPSLRYTLKTLIIATFVFATLIFANRDKHMKAFATLIFANAWFLKILRH